MVPLSITSSAPFSFRQFCGYLTIGVFVCMLAVSAQQAHAQADGKKLYQVKGCVACHGPDGNTSLTPEYPILAGQNVRYTVAQLKAYKSKKRQGGQSALMWGMAAQLSENEMEAIAAYLASVKRK